LFGGGGGVGNPAREIEKGVIKNKNLIEVLSSKRRILQIGEKVGRGICVGQAARKRRLRRITRKTILNDIIVKQLVSGDRKGETGQNGTRRRNQKTEKTTKRGSK